MCWKVWFIHVEVTSRRLQNMNNSSYALEPNKDKKKRSTDKTTFILNGGSAVQGEGQMYRSDL